MNTRRQFFSKSHVHVTLLGMAATLFLISGHASAESQTSTQSGRTELKACDNAKHSATQLCESGAAKSYDECSCDPGEFEGGDTWQCSVDIECAEVEQEIL